MDIRMYNRGPRTEPRLLNISDVSDVGKRPRRDASRGLGRHPEVSRGWGSERGGVTWGATWSRVEVTWTQSSGDSSEYPRCPLPRIRYTADLPSLLHSQVRPLSHVCSSTAKKEHSLRLCVLSVGNIALWQFTTYEVPRERHCQCSFSFALASFSVLGALRAVWCIAEGFG